MRLEDRETADIDITKTFVDEFSPPASPPGAHIMQTS
jgi:hypothetical protein